MHEEVKDMWTLAINCILAAMVFAFIALGLHTRNAIADARNRQIAKEEQYSEYTIYNGYDNGTLTGDEVVALIREFSSRHIDIYVDKDKNNNKIVINDLIIMSNPGLVTIDTLKSRLDSTDIYKTYLAYNKQDLTIIDGIQPPGNYPTITGIAIRKQ